MVDLPSRLGADVHVTMESPWHGPAVPELVSMIEDAWDEEYPMLTSETDDARPKYARNKGLPAPDLSSAMM